MKQCGIMVQDKSELLSAWSFPIIEREKEYRLTAKLYKSCLVIEDKRGNRITVSKRSKAMKIERRGNVEWYGEIC
jgi:hypothetical protein